MTIYGIEAVGVQYKNGGSFQNFIDVGKPRSPEPFAVALTGNRGDGEGRGAKGRIFGVFPLPPEALILLVRSPPGVRGQSP